MIKYESLPYFGKINSISRIIKTDEGYLIKRYDELGNEKSEDFIIPDKLKNIRGILVDYCSDLRDYLSKNQKKYEELKSKKRLFDFRFFGNKINLGEKISKIAVFVGSIFVGATISIISVPVLFWTGMVILVCGGVGTLVINDIDKELKELEFVSNYDNYFKKLGEFNIFLDTKLKNKLTEYSGLGLEKNMGNTLNLKKVKQKK